MLLGSSRCYRLCLVHTAPIVNWVMYYEGRMLDGDCYFLSSFTSSVFFFFSSRRRHTRYWRDWSSDVCSSDLTLIVLGGILVEFEREKPPQYGVSIDRF